MKPFGKISETVKVAFLSTLLSLSVSTSASIATTLQDMPLGVEKNDSLEVLNSPEMQEIKNYMEGLGIFETEKDVEIFSDLLHQALVKSEYKMGYKKELREIYTRKRSSDTGKNALTKVILIIGLLDSNAETVLGKQIQPKIAASDDLTKLHNSNKKGVEDEKIIEEKLLAREEAKKKNEEAKKKYYDGEKDLKKAKKKNEEAKKKFQKTKEEYIKWGKKVAQSEKDLAQSEKFLELLTGGDKEKLSKEIREKKAKLLKEKKEIEEGLKKIEEEIEKLGLLDL